MQSILELGRKAKGISYQTARYTTTQKNDALRRMADALLSGMQSILAENEKDILYARQNGMSESLLDRLALSEQRIADVADGVRQVAALPDPVGMMSDITVRPNGLRVGKMSVPLGVVAAIYEARPNVTVDIGALTLKSGNAVILRGGKEAINSNKILTDIMRDTLEQSGLDADAVQLVADTDRSAATALMRMNGFVDVIIPRGGAGLIKSCVENATVPVIETGTGNCHIYIDKAADLAMGLNILFNAKTSRVSVCNSAESLLVHRDVAGQFLPEARDRLDTKQVELRGCGDTLRILPGIVPATEEDFYAEFSDYILSIKIVDSLEQAITHINQYSTHHSDAIVTSDYASSMRFLNEVDSACVYVNASTRFTDGGVFGLGAEIGISTQKLHARGPFGLSELTSRKFIVFGNGQVR